MPHEIAMSQVCQGLSADAIPLADALNLAGLLSVDSKFSLAQLGASTTGIQLDPKALLQMIVGEVLTRAYRLDTMTISKILNAKD